MNSQSHCHIVITGRVQGVGYRAWLAREAKGLGLYGWVRNRRDGTVEALLSGPEGRLAIMISRCHDGPRLARVDAVRHSPASDKSNAPAKDVIIKPTA